MIHYGSAYNGIVSSITQFLNIVSVLRLGVAGALRVSLYRSLADDDVDRTSRIIRSSELYMRKIGCIILVYILVLTIVYPFIVKDEASIIDSIMLVVALGLGTLGQYFFGLTYSTLLDADQRQYIYNIVQTCTVIINTIISVLLIVLGLALPAVKLMSGLLFLISPFVLSRYVIKSYKINTKCIPDSEALSQRRDAMGHSIANIVHENTDIIILTLFTDVKIVSVYSVYALIMNGLKQVLYVFTTGSEAVFGNMWAKKENESISRNLSIFEYVIGLFVSIVFSATCVLVIPFVSLYTSGINDVNYILPLYAAVIVLAQIFYCIRLPYLTLTQAAGKYKETKKGAYLEAVINLVLSIILVNFVGIIGTAIGTLAANLFRTIQYVSFVYRNLVVKKPIEFIKLIVWIAFNNMSSCAIGLYFLYNLAFKSWLSWIGVGIILVILSSVITVATSLLFYRKDFFGLISILKRMLNRS